MSNPPPNDTPQLNSNVKPAQTTAWRAASWDISAADKEQLISLFYTHFFGGHPFLVPKAFHGSQNYPHYLDLVICYVGQHYTSPVSETAGFRNAVSSAMSEALDDLSVHRVQALLLYGIVLHSFHLPSDAGSCISRAAKIALTLGMNEPSFARMHASGLSVVEESFRRTWWELYTVDVYVATIHRSPTYDTSAAKSHPLLPCDQTLYEAGYCDQEPYTLRRFENRVFSSASTPSFSSYCYRIEAIRLVGRVLSVSASNDISKIQAVTNALMGWEYNLTPHQADLIGPFGEVDLLLFQAKCFISCARLFLHFPRSELPLTVPSARDVACARNYTQQASTSRQHTVKAISASKDLTDLAAVPWPLDRHSPFLVCGLVLGCIIQLATASIHFHECSKDCLSQHRDRVVLLLGALSRLGERWPLAQNAVGKLKIVAETVFVTSEEFGSTPSVDSGMDEGSLSNAFWFDLLSPEELQVFQS